MRSVILALMLSSQAFAADWREQAADDLATLRAEGSDALAAAEAAVPVRTRAGWLRYVDPAVADPAVAPWLLLSLDDAEPREAAALADAVARAFPDHPTDRWAAGWAGLATEHSVREVRLALWRGLHQVPAHLLDAAVAHALVHDDPETRIAAVAAVARHPARDRLSPYLVSASLDPVAAVRAEAARSMGVAGGDVDGLLRDADPAVRLHALRALGRLDPARAAVVAVRLAEDADPSVKREAVRLRR